MRTITGTISGLLNSSAGEINGVVLDNGRTFRFPPDRASRVLSIATIGSRVEVRVSAESDLGGDEHADAIRITNLDSQRSAAIDGSPTPPNPEVPTGFSPPPDTAASLAPAAERSLAYSRHMAPEAWVIRKEVVDEIEEARDALHRVQAMLTHLKLLKQEQSATIQYLDEAKHAYMQAISRCQAHDFEGAREFAAASSSLSLVVDILISKTSHSNTDYPRPRAFRSEHATESCDQHAAQNDLDQVKRSLARIHWVTENGPLPSEDRLQVQKLFLWSESFHRWARCLLETGAKEEALDFTQAAEALACSAEHLCKKCYVTRGEDSQSAAAAR